MIPSLAEFALYVVPGFLAIQVFRYFYPTKKSSTFELTATSLVVGVGITTILKWVDCRAAGSGFL